MINLKEILSKKDKQEENIENIEEVAETDPLKKAQKTVEVVDSSIEKGSFKELPEKLDKLSNKDEDREQYVFKIEKAPINKLFLAIFCFFGIVALYYFVIFVGTTILSSTYRIVGILGILVTLAIIVSNILLVIYAISLFRFNTRYNIYYEDLRYKDIELIDDLADYSKIDSEQVIKDLTRAIKEQLIPQGHFGTDNTIIIVSDEMYEKYKNKQATYDRYYMKKAEEHRRMGERTEQIQELLDQGQYYVDKIHQSNDIIKDKVISEKLDRMEKVVSMIFYEVDLNPQYADKLGMFMNYYLPTTKKLLDAYMDIDEKKVVGDSLKKSKRDIEDAIDKLIESFEGILNKFYQEKELDIATDISAMEILMKQDSLTK